MRILKFMILEKVVTFIELASGKKKMALEFNELLYKMIKKKEFPNIF